MSNATANTNPRNKPFLRRINAENQPFGDSLLPYNFGYRHTVGLVPMGPNRKSRRWNARWSARPKNQKAYKKFLRNQAKDVTPKRFTMVPGAPKAPKKRFNLWRFLLGFIEILFDRSTPWSKRGLRG